MSKKNDISKSRQSGRLGYVAKQKGFVLFGNVLKIRNLFTYRGDNMKALKGVLITLVVIIAIVGVTVIGGYVAVRSKYGIDLFRTAGQLKTLTKDVDESALCPNAYGEQDFVEMKSAVNDKIDGLIVYEKDKGYTAIRSILLHLRAKV